METVINLKLGSENPSMYLGISFDSNTTIFDLNIPSNISFDEVFSDSGIRKLLKESLEFATEENKSIGDDTFDSSIDTFNMYLNEKRNLTELISEISIEATPEMVEYIKRNPSVKSYSLTLNEYYSINNEDLESIDEYFTTLDNLKVYIDGNQEKIGIVEYKNTVNAINEIVAKVKKYNLSPLEQVMYAYDLVRDRIYVHEDKNEDYSVSRDLSSVLSGDKIVCVGFANILDKVLQNLGIKSEMVYLLNRGTTTGHVRNAIYIKDDKYDIEAMYYLDPTWDCKRVNGNNDFLNSYKYFCRTKEEMEKLSLEQGHDYIDRTFGDYKEDTVWDVQEIVETEGAKAIPRNIISSINCISEFIDGKKIINPMALSNNPMIPEFIRNSFNFDEVFEKLCDYRWIMFDNYLSAEQLLKLLMNVRKVEFYENSEKYPYDIESIKNVVVNREIENEKSKVQRRFLDSVFEANSADRTMSKSEFDTISQEREFEKQIAQVKLAKVLRKVYEQKTGRIENGKGQTI